ncbi:hypothetical protein HNR19_004253 [Nocardioides thalensis]|uniref:Uncharacterized protein n=1 Tax=Nocardioides thalensis TaxID=1914755 RepID=A0A853C6R1_9ACTN|nr:hypothetical protein [Nocardioides thalensis]NYJ03555.1 hypothetical protein [Nocardioides thalensis]
MSRRAWIAAAVAGAAVLGLAWWQPWRDVAEDGQMVAISGLDGGDSGLEVAHRVEVRIPTAVLEVTIGEPVERLPRGSRGGDRSSEDGGELHAPDGSVFVPIEWGGRTTAGTALATAYGASEEDPAQAFEALAAEGAAVVLRVGQEETELGEVTTESSEWGQPGAFVVADEDLAEATWEVTFDGVTQRVSLETGELEMGVAEGLYSTPELARAGRRTVGEVDLPTRFARRPGVLRPTLAHARPHTAAWLPDRGWVREPGQAWVIVSGRAGVEPTLWSRGSRPGLDEVTHEAEASSASVLLGGAHPLDRVPVEPDRAAVDFVAVWLVDDAASPPTGLEIRVEYDLVPLAPYARRTGDDRVLTGALYGTLDLAAS